MKEEIQKKDDIIREKQSEIESQKRIQDEHEK